MNVISTMIVLPTSTMPSCGNASKQGLEHFKLKFATAVPTFLTIKPFVAVDLTADAPNLIFFFIFYVLFFF